ncbi:MAG TPA: glycosyltransferase family 1 protein, partial [Candidatus Eisenbacteria bacterium]|nr:glycosyltransferase family 1 protein [Candidatus Eisenbacteria bacterium]
REAKRKISRLVDETKPDIAHIHNLRAHLTTSILAPLERAGIPIVWTLHDYKLVCPNSNLLSGDEVCERCIPNRFHHMLVRRCKKGSIGASGIAMLEAFYERLTRVASRVDRFIAPSRFLEGKMIEGGIDRSRIVWLPNFVDAEEGAAGPEGDYYLYVGRLSREKGVDLLIRAAARVGNGRLLILGDGPERGALERLAAELGAAGIEFLGHRTTEEVGSILGAARFVVLPSRWYENLPFSIMEAFAAGRPVVAADIGGIPEMVENGVNGFLFPPGDSEALAGRIAALLDSADLREEMGRAGRRKALELYNPEYHYTRIMEIYRELVPGARSIPPPAYR